MIIDRQKSILFERVDDEKKEQVRRYVREVKVQVKVQVMRQAVALYQSRTGGKMVQKWVQQLVLFLQLVLLILGVKSISTGIWPVFSSLSARSTEADAHPGTRFS